MINSWAESFVGEVWSLSSNWSKAKQEIVDQKQGHRWLFLECCIHELVLNDSICHDVLGPAWIDLPWRVCSRDRVGLLHSKQHGNTAESIDHGEVLKKENVEDHKQSTKRRRRLEKIEKWKTKPLHGQILCRTEQARSEEKWGFKEGGFEERDWTAYNCPPR